MLARMRNTLHSHSEKPLGCIYTAKHVYNQGCRNFTARYMPYINVYSGPQKDRHPAANAANNQILAPIQMPTSRKMDKQIKCFFLDRGTVYMICSLRENSSSYSLVLCAFFCILYSHEKLKEQGEIFTYPIFF